MTSTQAETIKQRSKTLALEAFRLVESLPRGRAADVLGRQLLRSVSSVAANYRAACRARSRSEFIAKLGVVEEEADETLFWLEMLMESKLVACEIAQPLHAETGELLAIVVASIRTAKK